MQGTDSGTDQQAGPKTEPETDNYKHDFISFALELGVLRFGSFTLKSGRISPYFFNTGLFNSGHSLGRLGEYYAKAILASGVAFDMLYGPAYKGIPLAAATAIALARPQHQGDHGSRGRDVPWAFNRKEAKDHGEGGMLVGAPLRGRVLMIDDVISAGTSARESLAVIESQGATLAGISLALDRRERGSGELSAVQQVERDAGVPVIPIVNLDDLLAWLACHGDRAHELAAIKDYRSRYGT